jgi:hypothetical protein
MFNYHDDSKEKIKSLEGRLEAAFIRIDKLEEESKFTFKTGKKVSQVCCYGGGRQYEVTEIKSMPICYYDGGGRQYEVDEIKSMPMQTVIENILNSIGFELKFTDEVNEKIEIVKKAENGKR